MPTLVVTTIQNNLVSSQLIPDGEPITAGWHPECSVSTVHVPASPWKIRDLNGNMMPPPGSLATLTTMQLGPTKVWMIPVDMDDVPSIGRRGKRDRSSWRFVAVSAIAHSLLLILFALILTEPRTLDMEWRDTFERTVRVESKSNEDERIEPKDTTRNTEVSTGVAIAGSNKAPHARWSPTADRADRDQEIAQARSAGILGIVRSHDGLGEGWSNGLDIGADSLSFGDDSAADSSPGFGNRQGGIGIGDARTIGTSSFNTIGKDGFQPVGNGWGDGQHPKGRTPERPRVDIRSVTVTDGIDRAIVRRYIRRHLARITACYERRLIEQPNLVGDVLVEFAISGSGDVVTAVATESVDTSLATCVVKVVKQIRFPKGGDVLTKVRYPFVFRRTGD